MKLLALAIIGSLPALGGYSYCQSLTIMHNQVQNTDQTNYVLTVKDTDPKLATVANGGYVRNASGYDIVFAADPYGRNLLTWDPLEVFNPATGQIITHVQVGTVSHTADTTIYRCAGNASITTFQGGATGAAWPSTYKGVWHLSETSGPQKDSTSNGNNSSNIVLTAQGTAAGKIGGADGATGLHDEVQIPAGTLSLPGGYTISGWVNSNSWGTDRALARVYASGSDAALYVHNSKAVLYYSAYGDNVTGASTLANSTWYYLAIVSNGKGKAGAVYVNGALDGTATLSNQALGTISSVTLCGDTYSQPLNGTCDEVRLTDTPLSADRIATDYRNQSSPSSFYLPGVWTAVPVGGSQVFTF